MRKNERKTIAIAGASGFIGRWLIEMLKEQYNVVALVRSEVESTDPRVEWRSVDLYSMHMTRDALQDVDIAIYLVHSMTPRTRLKQGNFMDTDLIFADNFARAAEEQKLEQIIFLGGLTPDNEILSEHLLSRYEVERTLSSRGTPLTVFRAGVIVGPQGSSFSIIEKLVKRLPMMICPKWTHSKTHPVALKDVLKAICGSIAHPKALNQTFDLGGADVMTYQDMIKTTAHVLRKKRWIFSLPIMSSHLSKLWVSFISGTKYQLISPLVETLKHELIAHRSDFMDEIVGPPTSFREAVEEALYGEKLPPLKKKNTAHSINDEDEKNTVRSVQRLAKPIDKDSFWVAQRYTTWLPSFFRFLVYVETNENGNCAFKTIFHTKPLLELTYVSERSDENRQLFYVTGGFLAKRVDHGWLEFRQVLDGRYVLAAIHDFVPKLPWFIYVLTQAPLHLFVMNQFGRYLKGYSSQLK